MQDIKYSQAAVAVVCIHKLHTVSVGHRTATSLAEWRRCSPPSNFVCGQLLTMCSIVCHLPQEHSSVVARPHFLQQDAQRPGSVQKRCTTTEPDFRSSLHWLIMSINEYLIKEVCMMALHILKINSMETAIIYITVQVNQKLAVVTYFHKVQAWYKFYTYFTLIQQIK